MELKQVGNVKFVEGGVCAAKGFRANGVRCGLAHKPLADTEAANAAANNALPGTKQKNDLAMIVADNECDAAAVYTTNKVKEIGRASWPCRFRVSPRDLCQLPT